MKFKIIIMEFKKKYYGIKKIKIFNYKKTDGKISIIISYIQ